MERTSLGVVFLVLLLMGGCATVPSTNVYQPMTARPQPQPAPAEANGAIYQAGYNKLALFEDRRARSVGDILTILLQEKTNASSQSNSNASRKGSASFSVPTVQGLPGKFLQGAELGGNSSNAFDGKGQSASSNLFTGTITVTVIEVLPNGNLMVSGEKQIAINQRTEYIRFSGVVNPATINGNNQVLSTQVADARIEDKGAGYIDEAQTMGWLARFFLTVLPF